MNTNNTIKLRKATSTDLLQLSELFDLYRQFYHKESDLQGGKSFLKERIEKKESVIFIAENTEGKLCGFMQLYPLFSSTRMKRMWLLNDLFVHPDFRGHGISVQLIEKAQQHCKDTNACSLTLETAKNNNIGNQLYPKTGFKLDAENNFYYWNC